MARAQQHRGRYQRQFQEELRGKTGQMGCENESWVL